MKAEGTISPSASSAGYLSAVEVQSRASEHDSLERGDSKRKQAMTTTKPKTYRYLNARIFNDGSGECGRIIDAVPEVRGWSLTVRWEMSGRTNNYWTTRDIWRHNRRVPECFKLELGPLQPRFDALIEEAMKAEFQPVRGHFRTHYIGKDSIYIHRAFMETTIGAHLYGSGISGLQGRGADKMIALADLAAQRQGLACGF